MAVRSAEPYLKRLSEAERNIWVKGEKVEDVMEHPNIRPVINTIVRTYELALDPEFEQLATATSHLSGEKVNRYAHVEQNVEDMVKRVKLARVVGQQTATCAYRCVGHDALNSLHHITKLCDEKHGTEYHSRFEKFLRRVQDEDLVLTGAMTDVKGDRGKKPHEQKDPDAYVHLKEKTADGIVVRGAKVHQSGAMVADYNIVVPTTSLSEEDSDYAVAFAIPSNAPGVTHILQGNAYESKFRDGSEIDFGNAKYSVRSTTLMVLDDVFVPWEHVFLCGEWEYAAVLVDTFVRIHRAVGSGCKAGFLDTMIGAAATIAEYNGVPRARHIINKLREMIFLCEGAYGTGLAAAYEGERLSTGVFIPEPLMANVTKIQGFSGILRCAALLAEIAGGLCVNAPMEADFRSREVGKYVEKFLKGADSVSTEDRLRMMKFIEYWVAGPHLAGAVQGGGPPEAQRMMILRSADIKAKQKLAKELAGIKD